MSATGRTPDRTGRSSHAGLIALGITAVIVIGGVATAAILFSTSEGDEATERCVAQLRHMVEVDPNIDMESWSAEEPSSELEIAERALSGIANPTQEQIAAGEARIRALRADGYAWNVGGTFDATYADGASAVFDWVCTIDYRDGAFRVADVVYDDPDK